MAESSALDATPSHSDRSPSEAVVEAVAAASGLSPLDLPPLYRAIDPDSLDSLFQSGADGRVRFAYAGYDVTVDDDGRVRLDDAG